MVSFCKRMPHATQDIKWGADLVYSVGGKMFAVFDPNDPVKVSFKATPEMFAILTGKDGIIPAPYAARFHWVAVTKRGALPAPALRELLTTSYTLVAGKLPLKLRRKIGIE